jgi:hypothetical protein
MHVAHEPVEMHALARQVAERVVQQVDQEGLAAADAAPQVEPAHRVRFAQARGEAFEQA